MTDTKLAYSVGDVCEAVLLSLGAWDRGVFFVVWAGSCSLGFRHYPNYGLLVWDDAHSPVSDLPGGAVRAEESGREAAAW